MEKIMSQSVCVVSLDVLGPIRNGGIGTAMSSLAELLASLGHKVTLLYPSAYSETDPLLLWKQRYAEKNIAFESLYCEEPPREISYLVHQWLKQRKFDVVHFHDWRGIGYWTCVAKRQGLAHQDTTIVTQVHGQTFWHTHHSSEFVSDLSELQADWLEQVSVEYADVVYSPSQYMIDYMIGRGWKVPERRVVRPNLLPPRLMEAVRKRKVGRKKRSPVDEIVFFGRLETRKGLEIFVDAINSIAKRGIELPKITFMGKVGLAESDPATAYVARATSEWRTPVSIINNFDVYQANGYLSCPGRMAVIASTIENSPYTVLECLALGIPFVAADVGGVKELIQPECHDDATFPLDPRALANLIEKCLKEGAPIVKPAVGFEENEASWLAWHDTLVDKPVAKSLRDPPTVSVVISTFNRPSLLEDALSSLERQTCRPDEVIIVDDASPRGPMDDYFKKNLKRFNRNGWRVLRNERELWPGASRNRGAQLATSEYIFFMDDDNIAHESEIETFVRVIQHTDADMLTCQQQAFTTAEGCPSSVDELPLGWMVLGPCVSIALFENCLGDLNMFVRRALFERMGGFREEAQVGCEDYELLLRGVLMGGRLETIPEILFFYRVGADRLAARYNQRQLYSSFDRVLEPLLSSIDPRLSMALRYANNAFLKGLKDRKVSYWATKPSDALGTLAQLHQYDLNDPRAMALLGDYAAAQGRFKTAANHYRQALALDPQFAAATDSLRRVSQLEALESNLDNEHSLTSVKQILPAHCSRVSVGLPDEMKTLYQPLVDGSILLRPRQGTPSLIVLHDECPADVDVLALAAFTDHEGASALEYGLAVVESGDGDPLNGPLRLSWLRVEPNTPVWLKFELNSATTTKSSIIIGIRVPNDGVDWFADAKVLQITLLKKGLTASAGQTAIGTEVVAMTAGAKEVRPSTNRRKQAGTGGVYGTARN